MRIGPFGYVRREYPRRFPQSSRGLIWVLQTQFWFSYLATRFSTSIARHGDSPPNVLPMINLAREIIRSLQTRPTVRHYVPLFGRPPTDADLLELKMPTLSDCSFATPYRDRSAESEIIIPGGPILRDGNCALAGRSSDFGRK